MENLEGLLPLAPGRDALVAVLTGGNALSARYGLALSKAEMNMLAVRQGEALRDTGRVEFGQGPYGKLVYAFCDSPYLSQAVYAETLAALCELFYHFKNEAGERWSDDELVEAMARCFNGDCKGSIELVADRLWQSLRPVVDDSFEEDEERDEDGDPYEE